MKKITFIVIAILMLLTVFAACAKTTPSDATDALDTDDSSAALTEDEAPVDSDTPAEEDKTSVDSDTPAEKEFTVGVVAYHFADQFCKWLLQSFENDFEENYPTIEYNIADGQGKVDVTIAAIEQFTTQQVDLIILQPFDSNAFLPAVQSALDAGIQVVCTNVPVNDNGATPYVVDDFKGQGIAQGEYYVDKIPEGAEIAILKGVPADCANGRREGLQEGLLDVRTDIKVVADLTANWRKEEAMAITEDWLLKYPDLKYIFAQSDEMAMGAIEAIRAVDKIGEIKVVAVGGTAQACVAIRDGELDMTVLEDAGAMAVLTNALAWAILNNEDYEKHQYIPNPTIDSNNVDQYLKMHEEVGNLDQ